MVAWSSLLEHVPIEQKTLEWMKDYVQDNKIKTGLIMGLSLLATYGLYKKITGKRYNLPPGPRGLPVIGNALDLYRAPKIWELFDEWAKKYGEVCFIRFGSTPTVILNTAEVIKEAFVQKGADFADRAQTHSFSEFTYGCKDIAFSNYSEMLKFKRKIALSAIRKYAQGNHLDKVVENGMQKVDQFVAKQDGKPFDPSVMTKLLVYNIIGVTCFGIMYDFDDPFLVKISQNTDDLLDKIVSGVLADFIPIFKYIPTSTMKKMARFRDWFMGYILEQLKKHKENFDPENITDFCSHVIASVKEAEENPEDRSLLSQMDDLETGLIIFDMFLGGVDSRLMTLHWIMAYLVAYPEEQAKIQQEMDNVVGKRNVSVEDKDSLNYTNAVIHEVMRIKPTSILGLPHKTRVDSTLNGYDIPKGTQVITNTWTIHHDEQYWKNPMVFNPDRWLDESGRFLHHQNGYLPFSMGRRNCIGEKLAKVDILMCVASLLQKMTLAYFGKDPITLEPKFPNAFLKAQHFEVIVKMRH